MEIEDMNQEINQKKRKETSKLLLWTVLLICLVFLTIIILAWIIYDRSDAAALAAIFAAPAITAYICYTNKSKAENLIKLRKNILNESKQTLSEEQHQEVVMDSSKEFLSQIDQTIADLYKQNQN